MSRNRRFVIALGLAGALLACAATSDARDDTLIKAPATLAFHRLPDGSVVADFTLQFNNTSGKALCFPNINVPGTPEFDPGLIKFAGPHGPLDYNDGPEASRRHFLAIDGMATRMVVLFRDAAYSMGVRVTNDDYTFTAPGRYTAHLRVPAADCAMLGSITSINDNRPGWFLGYVVAEAVAELR